MIVVLISCNEEPKTRGYDTDPKLLTKDFTQWWNYYNRHIILSTDFLPLDTAAHPITKEAFLKELTTGNYIPIRLITTDTIQSYQLYKLSKSDIADIKPVIKRECEEQYEHFKKEGTAIPAFNFTDLNGNVYNNENTKGKYLVLKCWYISCLLCNQEIPALNVLQNKYKDRKDILFVSLAWDSKDSLVKFLAHTPFSYAVVPDQESFSNGELRVTGYPAHFIINKQGIIKKEVFKEKELEIALKKEIGI
jgi:peroxiredoxin